MYKNQLQELAQRSCFNLPSYTCIREGPDHAPRFKATVNFNGEVFESPSYCTTLRQAEHAAAEIALNALSSKGPSQSLAARILDESGVYKNLLQEISQRAGAALPVYTTIRSGLGHLPVFTCTVELAGISFTGEPAKNKKQAEKKAALAAWASLKQLSKQTATSSTKSENDEQEQITIARTLVNYNLNELQSPSNNTPMILRRPTPEPKLPAPLSESKILPLIRPRLGPRNRAPNASGNINPLPKPKSPSPFFLVPTPSHSTRPLRHPDPSAQSQYPAVLQYEIPYCPSPSVAPPVTIRTAIPVFSALPARPPPIWRPPQMVAPPVQIRSVVPVFATPASTLPSPQPRQPPPPPATTTTTTAAAAKATPAPAVQRVKEIQATDEQAEKTTVENLKPLNL